MNTKVSIILPAKNEGVSLENLLPKLVKVRQHAEIVIVDDASSDKTKEVCEDYEVKVVSHLYSKGNGASIKRGVRESKGDILVFMDADGQHSPEDIKSLLAEFEKGYDMVVASRDKDSHASWPRYIANFVYNKLASWMTGHKVDDLTSGFRAVKAEKFKEFIHLLPNGFSYPTTITMAFFRTGYSVKYLPTKISKRIGDSHIKPIHDGLRFLLIIFKVGTLYSPLKFFVPISIIFFAGGIGNYIYTFITDGRFTNMSALLIITSILVFLIGLVSEQLTTLMYRDKI